MFVVGPAGSGKSTYCFTMQNHMLANKNRLQPKVVNLDPGQERSEEMEKQFPFDLDVRDLVSVADVVEELEFGPNGALVFCMEHLVDNLEWLQEGLDEIGGGDDEYFIFDCPGQIELYTHIPVLRTVIDRLKSWNINVCVVHVIDALFIDDTAKYISGALLSLTSMMQLQAAAVNVITKCDIKKNTALGGRRRKAPHDAERIQAYSAFLAEHSVSGRLDALQKAEELALAGADGDDDLEDGEGAAAEAAAADLGDQDDETQYLSIQDPEFFNPDEISLRAGIHEQAGSARFKALSESICTVLENYNLVHFLPLDITSEDSVEFVLHQVDTATQYGEDLEPRDPGLDDPEDEEEEDAGQIDTEAAVEAGMM